MLCRTDELPLNTLSSGLESNLAVRIVSVKYRTSCSKFNSFGVKVTRATVVSYLHLYRFHTVYICSPVSNLSLTCTFESERPKVL